MRQTSENLFKEIMANFYNLEKETDIQILDAERFPNKINPKRPTTGHIIIKMSEVELGENL